MASGNEFDRHGAIVHKVLYLLGRLGESPGGAALYGHIEDLLDELRQQHDQHSAVYLKLIRRLLDELVARVGPDSGLQIHLKIMQMSLTPPVIDAELARLEQRLAELPGDTADGGASAAPVDFDAAVDDFVRDVGLAAPRPPAPAAEDPAAHPDSQSDAAPIPASSSLENDERAFVASKRLRFQEVQKSLTQHVTEVISQNEEFGVFLEVELEALRQAGSIQEVDNLRQMLCKEVERLLQRHRSLASKLDRSYSYLQIIESDSQLLTDELTRAHLLSLTDELTGLPNRRAFSRRLEDEVARVQRYGYPLSLALIDLDGFKSINDQYGHAAGDEVLRSFSTHVFSIFRHHDMVSRYGGEEFAVLLPNTDAEGSVRAMTKVQRRAADAVYHFDSKAMPLPTFSAGLALYKPGETAGNLIERADAALYRAKRLGRNRIEQGAQENVEKLHRPGGS